MKKLLYIVLIISSINSFVLGQSCLPDGITFSTQQQIDDFATNYPGCTEIEGGVLIDGASITNLNGLAQLTSIGRGLHIWRNAALTSLSGLDNLTSIGGGLAIDRNDGLTSLSGLDNLTSIERLYIHDNAALTSLSGLENLTSIGVELWIYGNNALTSLSGLDNLTSIGGDI